MAEPLYFLDNYLPGYIRAAAFMVTPGRGTFCLSRFAWRAEVSTSLGLVPAFMARAAAVPAACPIGMHC